MDGRIIVGGLIVLILVTGAFVLWNWYVERDWDRHNRGDD